MGSYVNDAKYSIDLGDLVVDLSSKDFNSLLSALVGFVQVTNVNGVWYDEEGKEEGDDCFVHDY